MCDSLGDSVVVPHESGENQNSLNLSHEEKDIIIRQLSQEVEELKHINKELSSERDSLLCEVSRLKFELEMSDLKRLNEDRPGGCGEDRDPHVVHRGITPYYTHSNGHPHVNLLHQRTPVYHYARSPVRSCSNSRSPRCRSPASSGQRPRSSSGCKNGSRIILQQYTYSHRDYYLHVSYSSSNNQKLERPPCGSSAHAIVHNAHSTHAALPAHVTCAPVQRPGCHLKKGTVRVNGDVLKRSRIQTAYELSQDLLDKQIEMLERKYGGEKARNAALTIQRAFRRYTLLKKFDAITAMAKAERRLSRRLQENFDSEVANFEKELQNGSKIQQSRPAPLRSMSMREKRHLDSTSLPRSQSGCCELAHQTVDYYTPTGLQPCMLHTPQVTGSYRDNTHYYTPQEAFTEANHPVSHYPQCTLSSQSLQRDAFSRRSTPVVQRNTPPHQGNTWNRQGSPSPSSYPSRPNSANKKVPPEVPKRTSSISCRSTPESATRANGLNNKTFENGSLSSVQSSGSDSSLSTDRVPTEGGEVDSRNRGSPVWKRKVQPTSPEHVSDTSADITRKELSNTHTNSYQQVHDHSVTDSQHTLYKVSEAIRKRQYRVGLNLFNKKPERGIAYLIKRGFLNNTPQAVASFLITRKGLSRQMIGEYLGNLQNEFNMDVLQCFSAELDLAGMQVDVALRKFQTYFRMPGEAQKIERLMEVFSQRYCSCNREVVARLRSPDTVFVLAFAIIMLNTDLHTPNLKPERRMKLEDFIKNLRGIDDCGDIDRDMLAGIYERVKANEFKPGNDHVTQVMKVQSNIVGRKPTLALPHRRLVCYCRLYELPDMYKKERPGVHQREVFLFNDLLVVTKIFSKKKNSVTYTFRESFPLCGMTVSTFEVPYYQYGIRLSQRIDGKVLITFNARNEHDRCKFAEDLRESISEMDEMENLRIEQELERQKSGRGRGAPPENRDSGVADVEVCNYAPQAQDENKRPLIETQLKRSALSNSLLDIHEQFVAEKPQQRRGSVGSLDSGMSISFQSTSASTVSRDSSPQNIQPTGAGAPAFKGPKMMNHQQSFLGGLFAKRERKSSRAGQEECFARTSEV